MVLELIAHKFHISLRVLWTQWSVKHVLMVQHFIFQLMHTTLKNVELLKLFKIRKLFQHVLVYKENIIMEPQPVLS